MNHHAYLVTGDIEAGIQDALRFAERVLGADAAGNPDVILLRYGLFSVEDARLFQDAVMRAPTRGDKKIVIAAADRFFFQAQNALLKTFEEPPAGTYLVLVLPSEGIVLPTLRSRILPLPGEGSASGVSALTTEFMEAGEAGREKLVAKLLERTKSDKITEKDAARAEALALIDGLTAAAYAAHQKSPSPSLAAFLSDLDRFAPIMHESAAPLKQIFEHLLIVVPRELEA